MQSITTLWKTSRNCERSLNIETLKVPTFDSLRNVPKKLPSEELKLDFLSDKLQETRESFEYFWVVPRAFSLFWNFSGLVESFNNFWDISKNFGEFQDHWKFLRTFAMFQGVSENSDYLWKLSKSSRNLRELPKNLRDVLTRAKSEKFLEYLGTF